MGKVPTTKRDYLILLVNNIFNHFYLDRVTYTLRPFNNYLTDTDIIYKYL